MLGPLSIFRRKLKWKSNQKKVRKVSYTQQFKTTPPSENCSAPNDYEPVLLILSFLHTEKPVGTAAWERARRQLAVRLDFWAEDVFLGLKSGCFSPVWVSAGSGGGQQHFFLFFFFQSTEGGREESYGTRSRVFFIIFYPHLAVTTWTLLPSPHTFVLANISWSWPRRTQHTLRWAPCVCSRLASPRECFWAD